MKSLQLFLFLTPMACLLAQTPAPAQPATPPVKSPAVPAMPPAQAAPTVPPDTVVLTIGNEKVTAAEFDHLIEALPPQYRNQMRSAGKRQFAENVVTLKMLAQEAHAHKIDETPAYKEQLANQEERLLAQQYYQQLIANTKADEASEREYYDQHKSEYLQAKVHQILIRYKGSPIALKKDGKDLTDEEALAKAKDIRKKLADGGDFAALAKAESDDPSASNNSGDLGNIGRNRLPQPVEQVVFSIPVGEISEPVKSPQGYHIIKVETRQERTFVEVRPEIERKMNQELIKKTMDDLKSAKNVVYNPDYFGPPAPAPGTPAAAAAPKPTITVQPKSEK